MITKYVLQEIVKENGRQKSITVAESCQIADIVKNWQKYTAVKLCETNRKAKKFCEYCVQSGNASKAAGNVGYSKKTADSIGIENLGNPAIKAYIAELTSNQDKQRITDAP